MEERELRVRGFMLEGRVVEEASKIESPKSRTTKI